MSQFDRPLFGFRFVDTSVGDTLQVIAARELGDAARWVDLISYNRLVPPFITDDAAEAGPGVILTGSQILVPAPAPVVSSTVDPEKVFGSDVLLGPRGTLMTDGIDFVTVVGRENLGQALSNRIETDRGELIFHPLYGCDTRRLVGVANGPTASLLGAQAAKSATLQDPRISSVTSAVAEVNGDVINVAVKAETVVGTAVQASATV